MHTPESHPRTLLALSVLLALAAGCAGADPVTGTWRQDGATTPLPEPPGGTLMLDATIVFDADASPGTFDMHLDCSVEEFGLSDVIDVHGTYERDGDVLTLTFTEFTSGETVPDPDDGAPCVVLAGFGGVEVCFPAPQANAYALAGDTLSITVEHRILGSASSTDFTLARAQ